MRTQWSVIFLVGLLLGCGSDSSDGPSQPNGAEAARGSGSRPVDEPSDNGEPEAPSGSQEEESAPKEVELIPKDLAEPAILVYLKETLTQDPNVKIESVSDPMEPDSVHADLWTPNTRVTAYYVIYTRGRPWDFRDIVWVGMDGHEVKVLGYRLLTEFVKEVEKEWLDRHPIPE